MKNYFTLSEHPNMNYVATICSINELYPIENSDHLLRTVVNGFDIVVDKSTKIGDIVVYFPVESAISLEFLGKNNLFGVDAYILNDNKETVKELLEQSQIALDNGDNDLYVQKKNDAKALCGFFNDKGRVKTITLRGCPSQGFITPVKSLCNWKPTLNTITDWSKFINTVFDTVDGDLLVKKYVRIIPETNVNKSNNRSKKRNKNLKKFDRLYEDQFAYHYDTNMLNTNMFKFNPEDVVTITKKIHGTSAVFANVLCRRKLSFFEKVKRLFGMKVNDIEYGNIYSSRGVIKNRYINPTCNSFYNVDVWGWANNVIKPYLENGMTIYAEIFGYLPGSSKLIQAYHDYGCDASPNSPHHTLIMPYRITMTDINGDRDEWSVEKVYNWTINLLNEHNELNNVIKPLDILYHGKFGDLYPDIDTNIHWHENVLAKMKTDTIHFHMEEDDPTCTKFLISGSGKKAKYFQAPIEGIVIRRDKDDENNISCAYKLKTQKHYSMETLMHDKNTEDIEETESQNNEDI